MGNAKPVGALLVGKPEIAALAGVRRPVVTMWISRHRHRADPFPDPMSDVGGRQLYRASEVADWIAARGLGNNGALREEVALHALLGDTPPGDRERRFDRLTAVLCLAHHLAEPLGSLSPTDLVAAAQAMDPEDRCVGREIAALGDDLPALAQYADLVSDAAYGPAAAFEAVLGLWSREPGSARREVALTPSGEGFVGGVAVALLPAGDDGPMVVDPDLAAADLVLAIHRALPEHRELAVAIGPGLGRGEARADGDAGRSGDSGLGARVALRRLLVHGLEPAELGEAGAAAPGALLVTRLPLSGDGSRPDLVLAAVDRLVVGLPSGGRALVFGQAAALCDPIRDPVVDLTRWNLLRGGRIRLVARLPEGLLPARTGVASAIWVVGPSEDLAPAERWMAVADLSGRELDAAAARALGDDAVACLGDFQQAGRNAFHLARVVRTAEVIARRRLLPVPPPSVLPGRAAGGADLAVRAERLLDGLAGVGAEPLAVPAVAMQLRPDGRQTLLPAGQLAQRGELTVLPGLRLRPDDVVTSGEVTVLGPEEVVGARAVGGRRIDRIVFSTGYPRGRYTEPGDIVFTTSPRFGAIVDVEGSAVVAAPARIMRIADPQRSGLVPEVVARHLGRTAPDHRPPGAIRAGTGWRSWMLPAVDPASVAAVAGALAQLGRYRRSLAGMLAAADEVLDSVTAGLAAGTVTVGPGSRQRPQDPDRTTGEKER